jgi:ribonuclease HIII
MKKQDLVQLLREMIDVNLYSHREEVYNAVVEFIKNFNIFKRYII